MNFCNGFYFFTNACLRSLPAMVLSACLMGCQGGTVPVKEIYPRIQFEGQKGLLGASGKLVVSSEFNGTIHATVDPETNKITGLDATMISQPSGTYPGLTDFTQRGYIPSQQAYWTGFNEWSTIQWNGANQMVTTLAQAGFPVLAQAIDANARVQMAKASQPGVITQAAQALTLGKSGLSPINPIALWNSLTPEQQSQIATQFKSAVPEGAVVVK